MSPEQQRIAIAEACGWKYDPAAAPNMKSIGIMCWIRPGNDAWQTERVPNYLNDLNAMHEAEATLTLRQRFAFRTFLIKAHRNKEYPDVRAISSTAAQRAEAFLKTLNLWTP